MEGHRKRLKERYLREGLDHFEPHEVLEFLLCYTIPRKDVNETAHALLEHFGSLSNVLEASPQDLEQVKGVAQHSAILLSAIPSLTRTYFLSRWAPKERLDTALKMGRYAVDLCAGLTEECCYCVCLDTQNRVTARILLHRGSISSVEIHPRKVAEVAFRTHAASIVLVHNHPGGSLRLSGDDLRATEAMGRALIAVAVGFQDHIVVAGDRFVSIAKRWKDGYLNEESELDQWNFVDYPGSAAAERDDKGLSETEGADT